MNESQLCKAWTTVGLFLLVFSLDSWLRVQGVNPIFGSSLPHKESVASALLGFLISSIGILVLIRISHSYTSQQPSGSLSSRLPIAFYNSLDTSNKDAILFQRLMYFLFHIFPLIAALHFIHIILSSDYHIVEDCKAGLNEGVKLWIFPENYVWSDGYRLENCKGVTVFPLFEPVLLIFLSLIVTGLNIYYFIRLRK
jgi:hypothetical protein